ncbi:unnamed protein product [Linum tenue]|uniref:Uncharacterized protein n=1 Tax=Linum tenue TaxID=586396 RepID=A0AAV0IM35_9ROSI|nr:unnamed protein product [Linum tenue]
MPSWLGTLEELGELDLSSNNLHGDIPKSLGNCSNLVILDLSHNSFSGEIPTSLGNLIKLERLNLSCNHLQGKIPSSLAKLTSLHRLNLSNNDLRGRIPETFSGFPVSSFQGNSPEGLCGRPMEVCLRSGGKKGMSNAAVVGIIAVIVFSSTVICLVMVYIMVRMWCHWREVAISSTVDGGGGAGREQRREMRGRKGGDDQFWKLSQLVQ